MGNIFYFDKELCLGCGGCVIGCMDEHNISTDNALMKLYRKEYLENGSIHVDYYAIACQHCEDAPCRSVCPKDCFRRDEELNLTFLDSSECIGCRKCIKACPFSAISIAGKIAVKCNGCYERITAGLLPKCVAECPYNAITIKNSTEEEHVVHRKAIYRDIADILKK